MESTNASGNNIGFDFSEENFTANGYDELELAKVLAGEQSTLLRALILCREHNAKVSGKPELFTRTAIATRMCVTESYVSQVENGIEELTDALMEYAQAVGLRVTFEVTSAVDGARISENPTGK